MIKQECIGIPDMILLLMIFCFKKIKIKAEIVLSPGGAYFLHWNYIYILKKRNSEPLVKAKSFFPISLRKLSDGSPIEVSISQRGQLLVSQDDSP